LFFNLTFTPFLSVLQGRLLLPFLISSWQISNKTLPYRRSPSIIKDRSCVWFTSRSNVPIAFFKKLAIFFAALEFPKEAAGPVHENYSSTKGVFGWRIFAYSPIDLVAFNDELGISVKQGVEQQGLFDSGKMAHPVEGGVLGQTKGSACGIEFHAFGSGLNYKENKAYGK